MKNKFVKAGVAGFAALAIAAGGGTYSLWSDYVVGGDNNAGADQLAITLQGGPNSATFDKLDLAPGESFDQANVITGRVGGADINKAEAFLTYQSISEDDNSCGSQTEKDAEAAAGTACGAGQVGEFAKEALVNIHRTDADNGSCTSNNLVKVVPDHTVLSSLWGATTPIGEMTDGQEYCLKMTIQLPENATNLVQTDSSTFNIKYDLEQIPNS